MPCSAEALIPFPPMQAPAWQKSSPGLISGKIYQRMHAPVKSEAECYTEVTSGHLLLCVSIIRQVVNGAGSRCEVIRVLDIKGATHALRYARFRLEKRKC